MVNQNILIAGATGFVGQHLVQSYQEKKINCHIVSRDPIKAQKKFSKKDFLSFFSWDDIRAFEKVSCVINLAGENIAEGRWTEERKKLILESRVLSTKKIVDQINSLNLNKICLINASAIGYYGDRPNETCDELTAPASDFLAEVCKAWEREAMRINIDETRTVLLRIGLVLGKSAPSLEKMLLPFKLGLGGKLGDGQQWLSWIHVDDLVRLIDFCRTNHQIKGPINAVSPTPITNETFTKSLGKILNRPTLFTVPQIALKLALGEMAQIVTQSQKVIPTKALQHQFQFVYPNIESAWSNLI